jgi:hypothetical protein
MSVMLTPQDAVYLLENGVRIHQNFSTPFDDDSHIIGAPELLINPLFLSKDLMDRISNTPDVLLGFTSALSERGSLVYKPSSLEKQRKPDSTMQEFVLRLAPLEKLAKDAGLDFTVGKLVPPLKKWTPQAEESEAGEPGTSPYKGR